VDWAKKIGPKTAELVQKNLNSKGTPVQTHLPHPFFHKKIIIKISQDKEELQKMSRIPI
jgi:hypothetical protein